MNGFKIYIFSYAVKFAELSEETDECALPKGVGQAGMESERGKARRENLDPLAGHLMTSSQKGSTVFLEIIYLQASVYMLTHRYIHTNNTLIHICFQYTYTLKICTFRTSMQLEVANTHLRTYTQTHDN